jgi:integrase
MPGVRMHRFRAWYATYLDTADIRVAEELLGHEQPSTTAIYRAVAPQALRAAVAGLPLPVSRGAGGGVATAAVLVGEVAA